MNKISVATLIYQNHNIKNMTIKKMKTVYILLYKQGLSWQLRLPGH
jgi:hypothetical protein